MSRIRERGTIGYQANFQYDRIDFPYTVHLPNYLSDLPYLSYHRIDDEPGLRKNKIKFGNISHTKDDFSPVVKSIDYDLNSGIVHRVNDRIYFMRFAPPINVGISDIDMHTLANVAYNTMKPSLSSSLSLTNFLAELTEVKTMFKLFDRSKTLISNVAAGHLNWSFGWKPFISDLKKLYGQLVTWRKHLRKYISGQTTEQVRHFRKWIDKKTIVDNTSTNDPYYHVRERGVLSRVYHATMRYTYKIQGLDSAYIELKALLDMVGLKLNAGVIWEAIPFSFVIDWFVGVGNTLDSLSEDYLESVVTITDFCHSVKAEKSVYYTLKIVGSAFTGDILLGERRKSLYTRTRTLPNRGPIELAFADRYGTKQIVLSAALVLA